MSKKSLSLKFILSIFSILFFFAACTPDPKEEDLVGNVVRVRLAAQPDKLHPLITTNSYAIQLWPHIFTTLLDNDPKTLAVAPRLAKSLPMVEEINDGPYAGGTAYTFEILEEAVWDNGSPVLASDYEFTLKAVLTPNVKSVFAPYFKSFKEIKIDPTNPKKFTLYSPDRYILGEAVAGHTIYPEYFYDADGIMKNYTLSDILNNKKIAEDPQIIKFSESFTAPRHFGDLDPNGVSGCGPYKLEEWVTGQRIVLTKKENWWGDKLVDKYSLLSAYPDKIIYKIITDHSSAISLLKNNELDIMTHIPSQNYIDIKDNELIKKNYELHTPSMLAYSYIGLNNTSKKMSDKRVRQALAHILDKDRLMETITYGLATPTNSSILPSKPYYNKSLKPYEFSPEKARALLADAGWTDTNDNGIVDKKIDGELVELSLTILLVNGHEPGINVALLLQENAKKAGVQIETSSSEFKVMMQKINKKKYEMFFLTAGGDPLPDDPTQYWHSESPGNRAGFGDADSDALIEKICATLDEKKRTPLYMEFQALLHEEQPFLFLWAPLNCIAVNKRFDNATPSAKRPGMTPTFLKHKK